MLIARGCPPFSPRCKACNDCLKVRQLFSCCSTTALACPHSQRHCPTTPFLDTPLPCSPAPLQRTGPAAPLPKQ